ncbi:MAG: dTMP kinase [Candidatus Omnitrophica bacterium]|nr:dTMP kinase [Candidatus Omnitrophota bacterium]
MKKRGLIISFEGIDGCGKTTQAKLFYSRLKKRGMQVVLLNEPGGTYAGDKIRKILLDKKSEISPLCELFLYLASRAQLVGEMIRPCVKNGTTVILDRYVDSTIAYQGWGRGLPVPLIEHVHRAFASDVMPDITFLIDDTAENLLGVLDKKERDRIEGESVGFHEKVRNGYLRIAKRHRRRVKVIKRKTPGGTQAEIIKEWEIFINEFEGKQRVSRKNKKTG